MTRRWAPVVSKSTITAEEYLSALPPERAHALDAVRAVILSNLPEGYEETITFGMIGYVVPLERFSDTYNGHPLQYAALASQKNHMSLYLNCVYGNAERAASFKERYLATGRKLDMGKSCVRFRTLDQLPLDVIGDEIAAVPVDRYVSAYEAVVAEMNAARAERRGKR